LNGTTPELAPMGEQGETNTSRSPSRYMGRRVANHAAEPRAQPARRAQQFLVVLAVDLELRLADAILSGIRGALGRTCDRRAGAQELTRADKAHKEHKEHEEHKGHTTYKEKRRAHIKPKEHHEHTRCTRSGHRVRHDHKALGGRASAKDGTIEIDVEGDCRGRKLPGKEIADTLSVSSCEHVRDVDV
jgi:FKBP-type peptidyl-prolyl cis-trans isomerase